MCFIIHVCVTYFSACLILTVANPQPPTVLSVENINTVCARMDFMSREL